MTAKRYVPDLGDIVWVHFMPQAGHEQSGRRPAVVLSPKAYNAKAGLMLCVPVTNQVKGYPFEVPLRGRGATGVALADQVKSLDWEARHVERKGRATEQELIRIRAMIKSLLSIS
ncbi:MAG: endoribonuclease MazF [Gammaproteobacteria bacterium]